MKERAPEVKKRRTSKPIDYAIATLMGSVWLTNAGLITAAVFVFINWSAVNWMVGSVSWGIVIMVFTAIALTYVLLSGCCILGFRQHVERSYLSLRVSPRARLILVVLMPLVIFGMLLTLAVFSLADTDISTYYVKEHADAEWLRMTNGAVEYNSLDWSTYWNYITSLPQFEQYKDDPNFLTTVNRIFTSLANGKTYVTQDDLYHGVLRSLDPVRRDMGISVTACAFILVLFFILYVVWYRHLQSIRFEEKLRVLKTQAALRAAESRPITASASVMDAENDEDDDTRQREDDDEQL